MSAADIEKNNSFFRESFRGFNKDDVAEYIAKLSKDYTASEEKYKEHIAKLTSELAAKTTDPEIPASVTEEIENYKKLLANSSEKISVLSGENEELKKQVAQGRDALSDEQKMYESVTSDLGSIIYSAKKTAEDITEKAKSEAEGIVYTAKLRADSILEEANAKSEAVNAACAASMDTLMEKCGFVKKEHAEMSRKYKELSEIYSLRLSEVENTINIICDSVDGE
jgi:cell division septum initiation protein DivIVA